MKKYSKLLSVFTVACLATTLMNGCGKNDIKESETSLIQDETAIESETLDETADTEETGDDALAEVPDEVDAMRPILKALCKVMSRDRSYDPENSNFYWDVLYSAINEGTWVHPDIRMSDTGAGYLVPESVLVEYAEAMFADVSLPELPDAYGSIEYVEEEEAYMLYSAGGISGNMDIVEVKQMDEGYQVSVAFYPKKDTVKNFTFELRSHLNDAETRNFPCQVYNVQ